MTGSASAKAGFDKAFLGICNATTVTEAEVELSNAMHHHYRLFEWWRTQIANNSATAITKRDMALVHMAPHAPTGVAIAWARTFDVHEMLFLSEMTGAYGTYYTKMYGTLMWMPRSAFQGQAGPDDYGRDLLYDSELAGKLTLETLRLGFDQIHALV
ncbi:hypothetical protein [Rhodococcus sp. MEB064]|uniref:hypothetical protein n=1 Tax=Rhodococcus sp. MEB064 TaxID=1587522 RepID=UPI0005AC3C69|nr:hypothetical protein [Rhodococcus sp. MEB064]KIQ15349.1 hypothetical protein RU01_15600 [Rhodococcus sp. MEB064]